MWTASTTSSTQKILFLNICLKLCAICVEQNNAQLLDKILDCPVIVDSHQVSIESIILQPYRVTIGSHHRLYDDRYRCFLQSQCIFVSNLHVCKGTLTICFKLKQKLSIFGIIHAARTYYASGLKIYVTPIVLRSI